jgi:hypothetical protein
MWLEIWKFAPGAPSTQANFQIATLGSKGRRRRWEVEQADMVMDVSVEIHCGTCGSANYSLAAGAADDALLVCNDCSGSLGSVAELRAEMMDQAFAHSAEALRRELEPPSQS